MNRKTVGWSMALATLVFSGASAAVGQARASEAVDLDAVVVTGVRLQNRRAVAQKRDAERIVDSITADDVGALPDFSVAEAMTRIAGVSYEGRNGDAEFVVIRGLRSDFNYLEIDGAIVPSTRTNGRATQLSVIPSYVIRATDVVKSFTADLDANAIGAQVSVRTLSAFDQDGPYVSVRAALGAFEHGESPKDLKPSSRWDLAYASRFGADDQFGLVFGASYSMQDYDTWLPGVAFNEYRFLTAAGALSNLAEAAPADAIRVPHGIQAYQYNNEIEREGGYAKLEYRPNASFQLALSAYVFKEADTETRWDTSIYRAVDTAVPTQLTATSGFVNQAIVIRQYFLQGDTNTLRSVSLKGSWTPDPRQRLDFLISGADGERENPFYQIRFEALNRSAFAYSYDNIGRYPTVTLATPANWQNDALFTPTFYRPRLDTNRQEALQAKVDYGFNTQRNAIGWGIKAGLNLRTDTRAQDQVFDADYRPNSDRARAYSFGNVRLEATNKFEPALNVGQPELFIDQNRFLDYFNANTAEWRDNFTADAEALSSDFEVEEQIGAAYVMARFATEDLQILAGLRYEQTDLTATGYRLLTDRDPATPTYPRVTQTVRYDDLLPSISANWTPSRDFKLRAAYSRTLGRGEYGSLTVNGSRVLDDVQRTVTVTSGNPALKPRMSDNFDVSLEYYPGRIDGILALGIFHKTIQNEIFTRSTREEEAIGGVVYTVTNRRPENANGAALTGFELGLSVNSLDFVHPLLRDFGFTGNYARIHSRFEIEMATGQRRRLSGLIYQPEVVANASLFWAPGDFEARIAYRFSDQKLQAASASSPTFDEYFGNEDRVDLQARYRLGHGLSVFAEARNVNDGAEDQLLPYGPTHWTRDYGRSAWLGLTYKY